MSVKDSWQPKWYGMVWYDMVWYGMTWYGMVEVCEGAPVAVGGRGWLDPHSHGPMRSIGFLGRWGTCACPQCLPSDIVPIRSWTWTLRPPDIRHRHLPYHTVPSISTYVGFITPWEVAPGVTLLLWLLCWRCVLSRTRW